MKTIGLPCYGMVIELDDAGGGTIASDLRYNTVGEEEINICLDGIESLVLAHACAGIDVESLEYIEGIETAVDAAFNHWG
jgi:hypothetical protein